MENRAKKIKDLLGREVKKNWCYPNVNTRKQGTVLNGWKTRHLTRAFDDISNTDQSIITPKLAFSWVNQSLYVVTFQFHVVAASPKGTPQEKSIQTGSKDHANRVLQMARSFLRTLHDKNTFLPKVLAKVSREENSFIGASIAVSHFLRPIYLYSRVINRKKSLAEAIIKFRALDISPEQNWEFEAFERETVEIQKNEGKKEITKQHVGPKDLCQNCKMMFLGDKSGKGGRSFLGACAEYCPVDELLPDESKLKVTDVKGDDSVIGYLLKRNLSRCSLLFKEFENIYERCKSAVNSRNDKEVEAVYWEVIHKLNIFGLKPECNPYF